MNYLLIQKVWIDLVKSEPWFPTEAVRYPVDDNTPEFINGAYFIPEFRIEEHERYWQLLLGSYTSYAYVKAQLKTSIEP